MSEELAAGGYLDLVIHERVMGHCAHRNIMGVGQVNLYLKCLDCNALDPDDLKAPAYTTDIAAAMQVWGRLGQMPGIDHIELNYWPHGYNKPGPAWECRITGATFDWRYWYGEGETAPLAICRAALKAREAA